MKLHLKIASIILNFALAACFVPTMFGSDGGVMLDAGYKEEPPRKLMQYEVGHEEFIAGIQFTYNHYRDRQRIQRNDLVETWGIFFTLLEKNKKSIAPEKITGILGALSEEDRYMPSFKGLLIGWHKNYIEDFLVPPVILE
ncbi:MAG: hypothetical protein NT128_02910 [Proteobacteria bacterium]|nr:hypothetical protein [Pseudomonadota bacterium]